MTTIDLPRDTWIEAVTPASCQRQLPDLLQRALPGFIPGQRWFGNKGRRIERVEITRIVTLPLDEAIIGLVVADVILEGPQVVCYFTPVLVMPRPGAIRPIATVSSIDGTMWTVADAPSEPAFQQWLVSAAAGNLEIEGGDVRFVWRSGADDAPLLAAAANETPRLLTGEQSNSNLVYGNTAIIKVFRRVTPGINPDVELGEYLTGPAGYRHAPQVLGAWDVVVDGEAPASIGLAQALVANTGDGWTWMGEQLAAAGPDPSRRDHLAAAIRLLGTRTGQMHVAFAAATDPALAPGAIEPANVVQWRDRVASDLAALESDLRSIDPATLDPRAADLVARFLSGSRRLEDQLDGFGLLGGLLKTRVHGDYHLGQLLRTPDDDWVILDFEGEPARSLAERRALTSPLKDVAGILRSLAYARAFATRLPGAWTDDDRALDRAFLAGYRATITAAGRDGAFAPADDSAFAAALRPWVVAKALYEIAYERNNRPDWLWAPIAALLA
jgi:maltose alpha-D-glucosyltransferase / alpha-amylase